MSSAILRKERFGDTILVALWDKDMGMTLQEYVYSSGALIKQKKYFDEESLLKAYDRKKLYIITRR
jgi:hypothetical protein